MRYISCLVLLAIAAVPAMAQEIDISSLESLRTNASNVVNINLNGAMMTLARAFLSENNVEEAAALRIVRRLEHIQVRVFEFDEAGAYSDAALAAVRRQLDGSGWSAIVEVEEDDERVGVWTYQDREEIQVRSDPILNENFQNSGSFRGLVVLVQEPEEVVFVNIIGSISPDDLAAMGGQFGIPLPGNNDDEEEDD